MSTPDGAAQKKAANAKIDSALGSWPHSESNGELTDDALESIVRKAASPAAEPNAYAALVAPPFPEAQAAPARIRKRSLSSAGELTPGTPAVFGAPSSGRLPETGFGHRVSPPASGRISYPPAPASAEQVAAARADARADFGSRPSYPPLASAAGNAPSGHTPTRSSYPPPVASGLQAIHRPPPAAVPPLPPPSASTPFPLQRAIHHDDAMVPPASARPSAPPLSMPTLPPVPSVPNAPLSSRFPGGVHSSYAPPASTRPVSPWLLVAGAFVGATLVAAATLTLRQRQKDVDVTMGNTFQAAAEPHASGAKADTTSYRHGVDLSALPVAQSTPSRVVQARAAAQPSPPRAASAARAKEEEPSAAARVAESNDSPDETPEKPHAVAAAAPAPPPEVTAPATRTGEPSLNDLMKEAVKGKTAPPEAKPAAEPEGDETSASPETPEHAPARPSMGSVQAAFRKVLPTARACASAGDGLTRASVTFGSGGTVSLVAITGAAAGGPAEACMRDALNGARVQPFTESSFTGTLSIRPL